MILTMYKIMIITIMIHGIMMTLWSTINHDQTNTIHMHDDKVKLSKSNCKIKPALRLL